MHENHLTIKQARCRVVEKVGGVGGQIPANAENVKSSQIIEIGPFVIKVHR